MELTIKVICEDLPGTRFVASPCDQSLTCDRVYLGIQCGNEVIEAVPANRQQVVFTPKFRVAPLADGKTNFLGPFAKGTPAERFFYLSWVVKGEGGTFTRFGRAKIHLSHLSWPEVEATIASGKPLSVRLKLTDERGAPRCASLRGDAVHWPV